MPRNIAKCKLCNDIIESFFDPDLVSCSCGHISVWGGLGMYCAAIDFNNFMRVDDMGNPITVQYKKKEEIDQNKQPEGASSPLNSLEERVNELKRLIDHTISLPEHALYSPVSHADLSSFMLLIHSILSMKNQL